MAGNSPKYDRIRSAMAPLDSMVCVFAFLVFMRRFLMLLTEFTRLWQYIAEWERVFRRFDRDHSGTIERRELSEALQSFGYRLSPNLLNLIQYKYGNFHLLLSFSFKSAHVAHLQPLAQLLPMVRPPESRLTDLSERVSQSKRSPKPSRGLFFRFHTFK